MGKASALNATVRAQLRAPNRVQAAAGVVGAYLVASLALACDGSYRPAEAADVSSTLTAAAVRVRLEGGPGPLPDASVLAFKTKLPARSTSRDVMGLVDPLTSLPPGRDCELRDLGAPAGDLGSRGDSVDLEELSGVTVTFNGPDTAPASLKPSARLFPDITAAVGGVISESGPVQLAGLPTSVTVETNDPESHVQGSATAVLPNWPHLKIAGETPKPGLISFSTAQDLVVSVSPTAATTVEMRPFGTAALLSCAVPSATSDGGEATVVISKTLLARLAARAVGGHVGQTVPLAFDVVRRVTGRVGVSNGSPDLVIEVRLSGTAELHP